MSFLRRPVFRGAAERISRPGEMIVPNRLFGPSNQLTLTVGLAAGGGGVGYGRPPSTTFTYGDLDPTEFEGLTIGELSVDFSNNGLQLRFAGNAQIPGVSAVDISIEGWSSNPVTCTYLLNRYSENANNIPLRTYMAGFDGSDLQVEIELL